MKETELLFDLLKKGVSPVQAVRACKERLESAGFLELPYDEAWKLQKNGRYYVNHHDTTLFAFTVGEGWQETKTPQIRMAAAHTDFPCLRIKPSADVTACGYAQINVEVYGGAILNTWLDRPLGIAGRVAVRTQDAFAPKIVEFVSEKNLLTIPNLAIHMNREVNKGVELSRVRDGFKKAVDEEVKSQRMKTDLITNVSHDLKTPLTAITTYVELLKKEDITEEERRSYIETLDKKSQRLKILIEDLFEVSKATSNNIVLHPMEVDVVNLLKQVAVEHTERFAAMGLVLRWDVPEEKVIVVLDNQKTFRIFENLFVNIQKYAMPQSRVYVQVQEYGMAPEEFVEITIKNMSATELNFDPEEITERFVRGDTSRGTEGSGLGLAIARSFTEAQGGKLTIEVDGDLFKVVIRLKCGTLQVEKEMEV